MLNRVITWFDGRYSPVALAKNPEPPTGVGRFHFFFLRQFSAAFALRIGLVAIGAVADAMMPLFVGLIVGMLATTPPGQIFAVHGTTLIWMIVTIAVIRPLTFFFDTLVRNHSIVPSLVNRVRWQSHWHVIRQSWTFFQNDFAGRIGNKIIQAGEAIETVANLTIDAVWYAAVFVVVAVVVMAPEQHLLEHEEGEDAPEDEGGDARMVLRLLEEVRQQVEEHHPQQRPHRIAHQRRHPTGARVQGDERGDRERERRAREAHEEDVGEDHRAIIPISR